MSVPPLVCSTPPPPDHCDDDAEDDDFSFQYTEGSLSPTNQFDTDKFSYDPNYNEKVTCEKPTFSSSTNKIESNSSPDNVTENKGKDGEICERNTIISSKYSNTKTEFEEDNNIEDLNLKLDNLQIDFQNGKETVEDSLNENFDNFGTFFNSSTLTESPEASYYLPKIDDVHNSEVYDKEPKSQETFSDASTSIPNEDGSDVDVALEIPHDSLQVNLDISQHIDNTLILDNNSSFSQLNTNFSNLSDDGNGDSPSDNNCPGCVGKCSCSSSEIKNEVITNTFAVDWNENKYDEFISVENQDIQIDINDFPSTSDDDSKETMDRDKNFEIDSGLDLFTSFDKKDDGNDIDDFDDFTTFQTGENTNIVSSFEVFNKNVSEVDKEHFSELENNPIDKNVITENDSIDEDIAMQKKQISLDEDNDDDFGDFDAYTPCDTASNETESKSTLENDFTIGEFILTNDSTTAEKLNLAIKNIFTEDSNVEDNSDDIESNIELKTNLGESWDHLVNYEAEQSYLFTWNSSASQKSLLKSLGIDSRNILFGPKWNSNMPRFAANLGSNPLQPIKQSVNQSATEQIGDRKSSIPNEVSTISSPPSKEYDWDNGSHLTNTDFQAYLEHLMATLDQMTSGQSAHFKISDLFSNACNERVEDIPIATNSLDISNLQSEPIKVEKPPHPNVLNIGRKINLPDTHIFTPTDSETPWSHTIHYNDESYNDFHSTISNDLKIANSDVISNPKIDNNESVDDFDDFQCHITESNVNIDNISISKNSTSDIPVVNSHKTSQNIIFNPLSKNTLKKEESDDFGDFHAAEDTFSPVTKFTNNSNLLEPIKIPPLVNAPIVNWPEPGEVKSMDLDDFNDFSGIAFTSKISANITENFTIPDDLAYLPNLASGPTQIILKESKIENIDNIKSTNTEPIQSYINDEASSTIENSDGFSNIQHDGFSDFVSDLSDVKNLNDTRIDNNKALSQTKMFDQLYSDDFNDFQSANFVPQSNNFGRKDTFQFAISNNDFSLPLSFDSKPSLNNSPQHDKSLNPTSNRRQSTEFSSKNSSHQILQPLSLENYSQINWPNPGMDIQDLTRFNPVNSIKSYSEPKETLKSSNVVNNDQSNDDDGWSDFVSIKPTANPSLKPVMPNMLSCNGFGMASGMNSSIDDNEDWSDFVSSATVPKNNNELKTISQNIHSQSNINTPSYAHKNSNTSMTRAKTLQNNVPTNVNILPNLTYISPKTNTNKNYNNHFQNL